ncbi:MAG: hypothetical protein AMJ76_01780 [Dehalococcoidia bacterium SM23_28_1]|nr:MAG: hypothetical protein AMJ76_01780 [Dehalococcoidia bacterium SM23_28_1]
MDVAAQVSLYPLRQPQLSSAIEGALAVFREHQLQVTSGSMSTAVWGDYDRVFDALKQAFQVAAEQGETVMVVTLSNACPVPGSNIAGSPGLGHD